MVLGIRIKILPFAEKNRELMFHLYVGEKKEEELFFSNQKIREAIKKIPWSVAKRLGFIAFIINDKSKILKSIGYNPKVYTAEHYQLRSIVNRTGYATLAELTILKYLETKYPGYSVTTTKKPHKPRLEQLKKQGRKPGELLTIEEAIRRLEQYARRKGFAARIRDSKKQRLRRKNWPKYGRNKPK